MSSNKKRQKVRRKSAPVKPAPKRRKAATSKRPIKPAPKPVKKPSRKPAPKPAPKRAPVKRPAPKVKPLSAAALKRKRHAAYLKGLATKAHNKRVAAARKGWETRKKKAAVERLKREKKPSKQKPPKKRAGSDKAAATRALHGLGITYEETIFYEASGRIHRVYDLAIFDNSDLRPDPEAIEAAIERELMEGTPGTFHALIRGANEEGPIEKSTRLFVTQRGQGSRIADAIKAICELYAFELLYGVTLIFIQERVGYDSTSASERKTMRRVRRRGYRNVRETGPKGGRVNKR